MLNLLLEFFTVLWALDRQKLLILISFDVRRSVGYLNLPLENNVFELNFMARNMA